MMPSVFISDTNIRLTAIEEDVAEHNVQILDLETIDLNQNDRIMIVEDTVDEWDDRIVSLETINIDIQERLDDLEETILGENGEFYRSLLLSIFISCLADFFQLQPKLSAVHLVKTVQHVSM